ncbi:hypothetical protein ES703_88666 [subsurface metagenome]
MKLRKAFNGRYKRLVERSVKLGIEPPDKDKLWQKVEMCFLEGFKCCYCGCQMMKYQRAPSLEAFSLEHYIPFAAGGDNATQNIVVCCHSCNIVKGTMTGDTFKELMEHITPELKRKMFMEIWKGRLADKLDKVKAEEV